MTYHFPALGSASDWLKQISLAAQPIRSTTQLWVVTRHQYGVYALVPQSSFFVQTSGGVAKCRAFPRAKFARAVFCVVIQHSHQRKRGRALREDTIAAAGMVE